MERLSLRSLIVLVLMTFNSFAHAQSIPDHELLETVIVAVDGKSTESSTVLQFGIAYKIRASGTMGIDNQPLRLADSEYQRFEDPQDNTKTNNVDLGIGINDTENDDDKFPKWGPYQDSHIYVIDFVGEGLTVSFNFHDSFYADNSGSLTVEIFEPLSPAPEITTSSESLSFGSFPIGFGETSIRTLIVTNAGNNLLTLFSVALFGGDLAEFVIISDTGQMVVPPGDSRVVTLAFDPSTVGAKATSLRIITDDEDKPVVDIDLVGIGIANADWVFG